MIALPLFSIRVLAYKKNVKHLEDISRFLVGLPGLEPGTSGPESDVLPLHHSPILTTIDTVVSRLRVQRYKEFGNFKHFTYFFCKKSMMSSRF